MHGLSSPVHWWDEWQLRILVLASLLVQFFLFFSSWVRRIPALSRLRVLVWIAYIGGDALAIYALATLFNRHKQQSSAGENTPLEVMWAPALLIHLGGQVTITAYSLEDNELWKRHIVTVVSQVTVALYVFCKWWSGEKRLLQAAVLLFVLGILKFAHKPWALRIASFDRMQVSSDVSMRAAQGKEESLEEFVQSAKKCVLDTRVHSEYKYVPHWDYVYNMFVDRSAAYSIRFIALPSFLKLKDEDAYYMLQVWLGNTFENLYTKTGSLNNIPSLCSLFLLPFLALASVVLFATGKKDGHNENDIRVTYILLCGTTLLEFMFPFMAVSALIPACSRFYDKYLGRWHDMVSQYNLLSFCVRKKKPTFLMKLATFNFLRNFVNQHLYTQHVPIAYQITGAVRRHILEDGWNEYVRDAASYRRFSELRGQWAVRRHYDELGWSLKMAFDQSVVTWHVATDLCFHHPNTSPPGRQGEAIQRSREISNYMIYLLLIRPEMLMPGTRSDLFTLAGDQIEHNLENNKGLLDTEENLAREIFNMAMPPSANDMIYNARKLAEALMGLDEEEERWTVIQGVWVEMLCYSASRCRGYLHAKSLGDGGECLTTIWILLYIMGMETLADRHHRSEPRREEAYRRRKRRRRNV